MVGEGCEVQTVAGTQGNGDAVVIVRVFVQFFPFARDVSLFDGLDILQDVSNVPLAPLSIV